MSTIIKQVFRVLSGIDIDPSITEDAEQCELKTSFNNSGQIDKDALTEVLGKISGRDRCILSIFKDDSEICSSREGLDIVESTLMTPLHRSCKLEAKLRINKTKQDFTLSVYDYKAFTDYLVALSLKSFLDVIGNLLEDGYITLECYDEEMISWRTMSILFKKHSDDVQLTPPDLKEKQKIIEIRKGLCHWDKNIDHVMPGDFFVIEGTTTNDALQQSFKASSVVLMLMFLLDYSTLEREKLRFKLSGYKTISGEINTLNISNIDYVTMSFNDIRKIYEWCYYYGQHDEKIAIARNILSLNATFPERGNQMLNINNYTYDTIQSNYKFFEIEHVRQYVEVHGKLMDSVMALQSKVVSAVDGFIKEFKSGFYITMSFITSSVVIRSVNNDSFLSKPLLLISGIIILIYFVTFFFYRNELQGKISLMKGEYDKIRNRYGKLLSKTEKKEVFGEDTSYGSIIEFAEKQLKQYTYYWVIISVVLFLLDVGALLLL